MRLRSFRSRCRRLCAILSTSLLLGGNLLAGDSTYNAAILADNPLGFWPFDEASGTSAADLATANGTQAGTYENCTLGQAGGYTALGTCAQFNGATSRVRIEQNAVFELGSGDFSVELWYKTSITSRGDLFNFKNTNDFGIFANQSAAGSIGAWHNGLVANATTTSNAWHHVVFTRTSGTILMYVDGVQVSNNPDTNAFSANAPIFIGANHGGAPNYTVAIPFNGWIDEVAMYGSALPSARVLAHYQAANTPVAPVVANVSATAVTATAATIGAQLTTVGNPAPTLTLYWGDDDAGTTGTWDQTINYGTVSQTTAQTTTLTGLQPGKAYYFRAKAVNSLGTVWAPATATFTTGAAQPPTVETLTATGISGTAATLRGQITNAGNDQPQIKIYFGTTDGGTVAASWSQVYTLQPSSDAFSQLASPLLPLTTYFYRCFAENSAGSAWASTSQTFTTLAYTPPQVIINEIHYNEDDPTIHSEFIELFNPGTTAVNIAGWRFDQGINFILPAGASIPANGYFVVCEDPATLLAKWNVSGATVVSWQDSVPAQYNSLSNSGENVRLTDALGNVIDEVDYQQGFPWPTVGDPPNFSIELIHPSLDNNLGGNWRRSDGGATSQPEIVLVPTGSAAWHYRKALSEPSSPATAWRTVGFLEDASWLTSTNGAPFGYGDPSDTVLSDMRNAASPPGYTGIYLRHTFTVDAPISGVVKLKVWSDDGYIAWLNGQEIDRRGPAAGAQIAYNGVAGRNHEGYNQTPEEVTLNTPNSIITVGTNVLTIHALNESLNGSSDFYIDADLRVPSAVTGAGPSPLRANTVLAANAPPVIRQVDEDPVAPVVGQEWIKSGQEVRITAKITDPDGVASATLLYQIVEPGDYIKIDDTRYEAPASWTSVAMNDAGTGVDATANDGTYSALIPASVQTHRRLIRYRITAADTLAKSIRAPYLDDPQPNFAYFVYNAVPDWTGAVTPGTTTAVTYPGSLLEQIRPYHLITRPEEHAGAQAVPVVKGDGSTQAAGAEYTHSLYNWKGTLCYDGKVYDHIRFRARGGVWRFEMGKNMWKFDFNKGHDLEVRDNYGKKFGQSWKKLNFSSLIQQGDFYHRGEQGLFESVGFRLFQLANCPAEHTSYAHFRIIERPNETNGTTNQYDDDFQGLYLAIEQQDGQFLDEHGLPDGNLYKMESGTGELNNQGATHPKDKSDLTAFQAYTQTEAWWRANCDLENYYNLRSIIDAIHHYDIGDGKNFFYYHNSVTNKWTQLPWDLDLTWDNNMYRGDAGIAGLAPSANTTEPFFSRVWAIPALKQELQNRIREVHDLLYNTEQTGMLIDEVASFVYKPGQPSWVDADRAMWDWNPILTSANVTASKAAYGRFYQVASDAPDGAGATTPQSPAGTFAGMIQRLKNYITTRRNVISAQMLTEETQIPARPTVTVIGNSATSIPTNALTFRSTAFSSPNSSAFSAMKWRIAPITDPAAPGYLPYVSIEPRKYEIQSSWESAELTTFAADVTIPAVAAQPGQTYRVRVKHKDAAGRWSHWSAPITFVATEPDVTVYANSLVVSEVMYHPSDPTTSAELNASIDADDFEYLEVLNIGTSTLDLTPVRFTKGIDFDFSTSSVTSLAPGAKVLVVKNLAAFTARYGSGLPVAGEWSGNLANGGENIKLSYGAGTAIRDFTYGDQLPWPTAADGSGPSLTLVSPWSNPDHNDPLHWRASLNSLGTPGVIEGTSFSGNPTGDDNANGLSNLTEFALGANALPSATLDSETGVYRLTLDRLLTAQAGYQVELSQNLLSSGEGSWAPAPLVTISSRTLLNPTTERLTLDIPATLPAQQRLYLRVKISSPIAP